MSKIKLFSRYNNKSKSSLLLKENVQAAKEWLRKRAYQHEVEINPELNISFKELEKVDSKNKGIVNEDDSLRLLNRIKDKADNHPDFLAIKNLLLSGSTKHPNYVLSFTKFRFLENLPMFELENLYKRLKDLSPYLSKLPMNIDRYAQTYDNTKSVSSGSEKLNDDLTQLEILRATDRFIKNLPGEFIAGERAIDRGKRVPSLKDAFRNAPDSTKRKIQQIAYAFEQMGMVDGFVDEEKNRSLQEQFFKNIRRYRTLSEVITAAQRHLKGANLDNELNYLEKIEEVNRKFGKLNGCEICYYEDGLLITRVNSYQANAILNSDTGHCIATSSTYWNSYLKDYNVQYYIRDFNKTPDNIFYVIGLTVGRNGTILHCHLKDDTNYLYKIEQYIDELGIEQKSVFVGLTDEEIETRERIRLANKGIMMKELSIVDLNKYLEWGADPNIGDGTPLFNAATERNLEKIELLINKGADPSIGEPLSSFKGVSDDKYLNIVKMLISRGANVDMDVFDMLLTDYNLMRQVIEDGKFDTNQSDGLPLRRIMYMNNVNEKKKFIDLLVQNGADISLKNWICFSYLADIGDIQTLNQLVNIAKNQNKWPTESQWKKIIQWAETSDLDEESKKNTIDWLEKVST